MAELDFIFDPTSPTFRPIVSSAAKPQGGDANVDAKATEPQLDAALGGRAAGRDRSVFSDLISMGCTE